MIPYELRDLIDLALEDGVLTDKEREIIFARAKAQNDENEDNYVDLDEPAIYIDNKLPERQNELKDDGKIAVKKLMDEVGMQTEWTSSIEEIAKFELNAVKNANIGAATSRRRNSRFGFPTLPRRRDIAVPTNPNFVPS